MGEMADYALEEVLNEEDARTDYLLGNMPEHKAYEIGIIDELGRIVSDPILGINAERSAAQRRRKLIRHLRQQGVVIPSHLLHNEAALMRLCAEQAPVPQGNLDLA